MNLDFHNSRNEAKLEVILAKEVDEEHDVEDKAKRDIYLLEETACFSKRSDETNVISTECGHDEEKNNSGVDIGLLASETSSQLDIENYVMRGHINHPKAFPKDRMFPERILTF